jgi:hypothetical protein
VLATKAPQTADARNQTKGSSSRGLGSEAFNLSAVLVASSHAVTRRVAGPADVTVQQQRQYVTALQTTAATGGVSPPIAETTAWFEHRQAPAAAQKVSHRAQERDQIPPIRGHSPGVPSLRSAHTRTPPDHTQMASLSCVMSRLICCCSDCAL